MINKLLLDMCENFADDVIDRIFESDGTGLKNILNDIPGTIVLKSSRFAQRFMDSIDNVFPIFILSHPKIIIDDSVFINALNKHTSIMGFEKYYEERRRGTGYFRIVLPYCQDPENNLRHWTICRERLELFIELLIVSGKVKIGDRKHELFDKYSSSLISGLRNKYGFGSPAADIFAQIIFVCDGLLEVI